MNNIIPFDICNPNHVASVLKLSEKNKFYHNDLYLNLMRVPLKDDEILKQLKIGYDAYCTLVKEFVKDAPLLFGYLLIIKKKNGKTGICGFILGDKENEELSHLHYILVDASYRNCGYGNQLMKAFLDNLPRRVNVEIKTESTELINWYNKFGFYEDKIIDSLKLLFNKEHGKYDNYVYMYRMYKE